MSSASFLSSLPPPLASLVSTWPQLRDADPIDNRLAHELVRLADGITGHLHAMHAARQANQLQQTAHEQAEEANGRLTPQQERDASTYQTLFGILGDVQKKQQDVRRIVALRMQQQQQLQQQQQQQHHQQYVPNNDDQPGADGGDDSPNQQIEGHQSHDRQPSNIDMNAGQSSAPAPRASAAAAASASSASSAASSAGAPSGMVWLLPEGRRRLALNRYTKVKTLRKTLFGCVILAADTERGNMHVAIKLSLKRQLISGRTAEGNPVMEDPMGELKFLRLLAAQPSEGGGNAPQQLGASNVTQLLDECEDETNLYTVLELCTGGEFFDIVCAQVPPRFAEPRAAHYFRQLAHGVSYIHEHLIAHLDLSLENLLLDGGGVAKICDFGVARTMDVDQQRHIVPFAPIPGNKPGKTGYMAPELFAGQSFYGHLSDTWALGIMLFIMLTGVPPFSCASRTDPRFCFIYDGRLDDLLRHWNMLNLFSETAKDCIRRLLCPPADRMNIQQVLRHPFITGGQVQ